MSGDTFKEKQAVIVKINASAKKAKLTKKGSFLCQPNE